MNIVVLCGGTSTERAVSLVTGEQVCKALRRKNNNAILLDVFIGHKNIDIENIFYKNDYSIEEELEYIKENSAKLEELKKSRRDFFGPNVLELCKKADIVFLALHGANGEDGRVQATFDLNNIKYTGCDYLSSAIAMSKEATKKIFKACDVPCANSFSVNKAGKRYSISDFDMEYPVVVKANCGGSSIGVYIVNNDAEYEKALDDVFEIEDCAVVESYIKGREFSVGVIDYNPLPIIEIIPKEGFYDYENKYKPGATLDKCPADIPEDVTIKIKKAALKAAKAIGLSVYCRVDVLTDSKFNCYCLEANTLPGMTPTSLLPQEAMAMGMDFETLCQHLVDISLNKYQQ